MASFNTLTSSNRHKLITGVLIILAFGIGLLLPSPISFKRSISNDFSSEDDFISEEIILTDTANMILKDGAIYEGSINAKTKKFHGYGILSKGVSTYEGNWKNGTLPHGKRTTSQSVYEGRFDKDLNNHGFGIITYMPGYIDQKRKQGLPDNEITVSYVGNWNKNLKNGLGRALLADSTLEFGHYKEGLLKKLPEANYNVGEKVYGIDISRHQKNINWDQLALYCDENGNVYRSKPVDKKHLQPVFFVYMKATEGATVKDKTFDVRSVEADRHGVAKGAYHFMRLGSSIDDQIKNFTETAKWAPGDMPPALDVEVESEIKAHGVEKLLDMTYTWLEEVEKIMKVRPIIYTRESIRDKYLKKDPRFNKYQCWIARYHPDGPNNPDWKLWQMSETGKLNGYDGAIDINLFQGDYTEFTQYLNSLSPALPMNMKNQTPDKEAVQSSYTK